MGIGWDLSIPHIERFTLRGLPRYDSRDVFAADGSEELVRVESTEGRVYRARFERDFVRYTWRGAERGRGGYWVAEYPDGSLGYFGADRHGSPVPSARAAADGRVFRYMLVQTVDTLGHSVRYHYELDGRYPLLSRIEYAFLDPCQLHPPSTAGATPLVEPSGTARYQVRLDYVDRGDEEVSNALPGFDLRLSKRLTTVEVWSGGVLLRGYHLTYEQARAGTSRLSRVDRSGVDGARFPAGLSFAYSSALGLGCTDCSRPHVFDMGTLQASGSGGLDLQNGRATLIDMNGDALPDLLDTGTDGRHRFFMNTLAGDGAQWFSAPHQSGVTGGGSSFVLDRPSVQVADLDGNGFADVFDSVTGGVLCNTGTGDWEPTGCGGMKRPEGLVFYYDGDADPRGVRFLDADGDKRIDVLQASNGVTNLWLRTREGFVAPETDPDPLEKHFDDGSTLQLADLNGDGLLEPVQVDDTGVWYRLHLGRGRFAEARLEPLQWAPSEETDTIEKSLWELQDLNGDGLDDVVAVVGQRVHFALNQGGTFRRMEVLDSSDVDGELPMRDGHTTVLFADMNASGTTDILWVHPSTGRVRALELFALRPNLLTRIDNGLGGIQTVEYGTSARQQALDAQAGVAWRHRLPQAINLVTATERYTTLTPDVRERLERAYHHGFYDGAEKRYRGFESVEETVPGDDTQEASLRESTYDVGSQDVYRQGLLTLEAWFGEREDGRYPIRRSLFEHADCDLAQAQSSDPDRPIRWLCERQVETLLQEGRPRAEWVTLRTRREYDAHGNVRLDATLGVVGTGEHGEGVCAPCSAPEGTVSGACGEGCLGDERYTQHEYIVPGAGTGGRWQLGTAWRTITYSEPGGAHTETLRYFDGPAFRGLPQGRANAGLLTRVCERATTDAPGDCRGEGWVRTHRVEHDCHGNVVSELDPLGAPDEFGGHRRAIRYDGYQLEPRQVTLFLSNEDRPYQLTRSVDYDPIFHQPSRVSRWMLQNAPVVSQPGDTRLAYDAFGRRSAVALPGDSLESPTQSFHYGLSAPVSGIVVRGRSVRGEAPDLEQVQCVDGFGRHVQTRTHLGEGRYQVTGFHEVNAQGAPARVYQPYLGARPCDTRRPEAEFFTSYRYDALGRLLEIAEPDAGLYGEASIRTAEYAPLVTTRFDAEDNDPHSPAHDTPHRIHKDGLGRVVLLERSLQAGGETGRVRSLWDELGRLSGSLGAGGLRKRQEHDLLGRVREVHDPDAGFLVFEYDSAGNLVARTDGRGKTLRMQYDGANRPLTRFDVDQPEASLVRLRYDFTTDSDCQRCTHAEGRLVQSSYPLGATGDRGEDAFGYDSRGRARSLARSLLGHRFVTSLQHDNAGRVTSKRYPDGTLLTRGYDGASRPIRMEGVVGRVRYDPRGLLQSIEYANGARTLHQYDARQRLAQVTTQGREGGVLQGLGYEYDRASNVSAIADLADPRPERLDHSVHFRHDAWYRMTQADFGDGRETVDVSFDRLDNLLAKVSSLGTASAAHVGSYRYEPNRPHAVRAAGSTSLEYDEAGRLTQRGDLQLRWDYLGRLQAAEGDGARTSAYFHGADMQRVLEVHGDSVTYHVGPDFEVRDGVSVVHARLGRKRVARLSSATLATDVLPDLNGSASLDVGDAWMRRREVRAAGRLLRACARRLLMVDAVFLHGDALGSLTLATGTDGSVRGERAFYPTGEVRLAHGHVGDHGFTGQRRDPTTGLAHFLFRELDTATGRWTSPDPLFATLSAAALGKLGQSTTAYAYVAGSFASSVDPTGLVLRRVGNAIRRRLRRLNPRRRRGDVPSVQAIPIATYVGEASPVRAIAHRVHGADSSVALAQVQTVFAEVVPERPTLDMRAFHRQHQHKGRMPSSFVQEGTGGSPLCLLRIPAIQQSLMLFPREITRTRTRNRQGLQS